MTSKKDWGVNYRALHDLFQISQNRRSSIMYEVGVQMVEIYNEQVRDLLTCDGSQKRYPFFHFSSFPFIVRYIPKFESYKSLLYCELLEEIFHSISFFSFQLLSSKLWIFALKPSIHYKLIITSPLSVAHVLSTHKFSTTLNKVLLLIPSHKMEELFVTNSYK